MLKKPCNVLTMMLAFCIVTVIVVSGVHGQIVQQETEPGGDQSQPEVKQKISFINIQNNNLSVELVDAEFGAVLQSIAQKSGFRVVIGGNAFNKKVSTKFDDMELERGLMRLFNLIREKNYAIKYDSKGKLDLIEVFAGTASSSAPAGMQPQIGPQMQRPVFIPPAPQAVSPPAPSTAPDVRNRPVPLRPPFIRSRPVPQSGQPQTSPQVIQDNDDEMDDDSDTAEEAVKEIPYIPPQKKPIYIPPKTR